MKKTKLFMTAAMSVAMLSACSDEVMTSLEQRGDEISFRASAENMTRAIDSYCNNNLPSQFTIYAKTTGKNEMFIPGETAVRDGFSSNYNLSGGVRYWPNKESLDFLALHNDKGTFNENFNNPQFVDYTINDKVEEQLDLIYAKEYGKSRPAEGGNINLNFRHALSQVVFNAKLTNPNLRVYVDAVTIGNLKNKGTFTFANANSTSGNFTSHSSEGVDNIDESTVGSWSGQTNTVPGELKSYNITFLNSKYVSADGTELSRVPNHPYSSTEGWSNVMILLPQQNKAWDPEVKGDTGTYLALYCSIYNNRPNADLELNPHDTLLHEGYIFIPLEIDWKPGVRYIYTINFGYGQAGYYDPNIDPDPGVDPDPDPEPPVDPKPTLEVLSVSCTTDDFVNVSGDINSGDGPTATGFVRLHHNYGGDIDTYNAVSITTDLPDYKYYFTFGSEYNLKRDGYRFNGWALNPNAKYEEIDFPTGSYTYLTLDGTNNNEYDYYAIWGERDYTVVYTDGVPGKIVFEDLGYEGRYEGDETPKFGSEHDMPEIPTREGYKFVGWSPEVNPTIVARMANKNKVITYTAIWEEVKDEAEAE